MTEELTAKDAREKTAKALKRKEAERWKELMEEISKFAGNGYSSRDFYYLSENEKNMLEELGYNVERRIRSSSPFDAQYSYGTTEDYYVVSW